MSSSSVSPSSATSSLNTGGGGGSKGMPDNDARISAQQYQHRQNQPYAPAQQRQQQQHAKRTRVLLSCAPCRGSKLKCDRAAPCGQCIKRGRPDACAYAPRPEKPGRPAKSMAARLKRLEGMVREMIDADGNPVAAGAGAGTGTGGAQQATPAFTGAGGIGVGVGDAWQTPAAAAPADAGGVVVQGQKATSYVGATHFMAMLDDVSFFKFPLHSLLSINITGLPRSRISRATSRRTRRTRRTSVIPTRLWGRRNSSSPPGASSRIGRSC